MSLKQPLKRGDWVRATHVKTGAVVDGQAEHDMGRSGSASLGLRYGEKSDERMQINVNDWDVVTIKKNLLSEEN